MIKNLSLLFVPLLVVYSGAHAASCTLSTLPSPVIASYEKNVDTILKAAKSLAGRASCGRDGSSGGALSSGGTKRALDIVQGSHYDIGNYFRSNAFYLDTSDKTLLPSAQNHDKYILGIQQKILATTAEIGSKCAGDIVSFPDNIDLGDALYKTKKRTLQEVMNNLYVQSSQVQTFYRDLASNIRNSEYRDETNFTIAPVGFSDKMREFYSAENIEQCHNEDPKKQQIQEKQKQGLAAALKYPQGVSIWKKAFQLLLYGNNILSQSQEGEPHSLIAHAKKGGLGNSQALLNNLFTDEFGFPGNSQSTSAGLKESAKQNAYGGGLQVPTSFSQVSAQLQKSSSTGSSASSFLDNSTRAKNLGTVVTEQFESRINNEKSIAQYKQDNYLTTIPLVNALDSYSKARESTKEIVDKVCEAYGRQAVNLGPVQKPSCDTFFSNRGGEPLVVPGNGEINSGLFPPALLP